MCVRKSLSEIRTRRGANALADVADVGALESCFRLEILTFRAGALVRINGKAGREPPQLLLFLLLLFYCTSDYDLHVVFLDDCTYSVSRSSVSWCRCF